MRTDHQALLAQWEAEKRRDAQIDARGLPLIGLGILLAGVPDGLAKVSWIGWTFLVLSVLLILWLGVWPLAVWLIRQLRRDSIGMAEPEDAAAAG